MTYYKVGDKVQIKSREWFEENGILDYYYTDGLCIPGTDIFFNNDMFKYCGEILEVVEVTYANRNVPERVYILNTKEDKCYCTGIINTQKKTWVWSEKMIIGVKELRKQKLQKLKSECIK
jgi:hypothetical protein